MSKNFKYMDEKLISNDDRIFVAGSKGMAGSAICRKLIEKGYGSKINKGSLLCPTRSDLDLSDIKSLEEWFKKNKPSVIVDAAAKVGGILANSKYPAEFLLENLKIQNNLIEVSWKFGIKRFLFLGSSCIYPKYSEQPIREESLLNGQLEDTNLGYALAKISGIKLCEFLRIQYNFDAISLMPTNLYGPKDNYHNESSHVMAALIRKFSIAVLNNEKKVICWGSGRPMREFMHVDDLADAVVFALESWNPDSESSPLNKNGQKLNYLNVGTGKDISIKELSLKIAKASNFEGEIIWDHTKPDGMLKKQLDISRIKILGWEAKIDLDSGIKNTVKEYQQILLNQKKNKENININ